jgi:hypothetical protein
MPSIPKPVHAWTVCTNATILRSKIWKPGSGTAKTEGQKEQKIL